VVAFNGRESTEAGSYQDSDTLGILLGNLETGVLHGEMGGAEGILDKEVHLLDFFFLDEILGDKILYFPGYPNRKISGVKPGYEVDPRSAGSQGIPVFQVAGTEWGNNTDSRYNNSSHKSISPRSANSCYFISIPRRLPNAKAVINRTITAWFKRVPDICPVFA
jgi:hypothetical protein